MLIFLDLSIFLTTILFIGYFYSTNYIITLYYKKGEFTQDKKWNYAKFVMICTLFVFSLLFSLLIFRFESEVKNLLPQFKEYISLFKEYISFYNYTFCFFVLLCMVPYILHYFNNVYFDLFEEKFFKKNFLGIFIFTSFLSFPVFIINSVLSYMCFIGLLIFPEKIKNHSSAFNMSMFFIVYNSLFTPFITKGEFFLFNFLFLYDFYFSFNDKEKMLKDRIIIRILYFLLFLFYFVLFLLFLLYFVLFLISLIFIPSSFYSFLSYVGFLLMLAISIFTIHCSYYFYVIFIEMFYRSIYNKSYWLGE